MMSNSDKRGTSRKNFIKKAGLTSAALFTAPSILATGKKSSVELPLTNRDEKKRSVNDRVNLALIGAGGMGQGNINIATRFDGFEIVAACDLYDSRLTRCKERFGDHLFTTRDYHEIIDRSDVDAVVVATSDHWHDQIAIDAMNSGKAVYLEKPITQHVDQAYRVVGAEKQTGMPLIVGSQRSSNIVYEKAKELYEAGEIGKLNFAEAYWDRFSAMGAWQYSIPPGATEQNVDWRRFRKDLPQIPFDPVHFFRWRNYSDYGTGVSGDLFVHLFSGLHMIVDSYGPERIYSTGGLRHWHDGRDAADVVLGLFDYPETDNHPAFNLSLRVNFADGSGGGSLIRLVGTEGEIQLGWNRLVLKKSRMSDEPGMSIGDFSQETREEYEKYYREKYPETRARIIEPSEFEYRAPDGYSDSYDHFVNFYRAIREGADILQDGEFGLRAAGPALLANQSLEENRIINWDPVSMEVL